MDKSRLEMLTDGVFAIVMTLLVLELKVPEGPASEGAGLWHALVELQPVFRSYAITFVVLTMFWTMHHAMFHFVVRRVDRVMIQMSLLYLGLLSLLPFSAHLLGAHPEADVAVTIYGVNVLAIGLVSLASFRHAVATPGLHPDDLDPDLLRRATVRQWIVPMSAVLGILAAQAWVPLALGLYAFPVIFNLVPGLLGGMERGLRRG